MLRTSHSLLALSLFALTGCPEEPATVFSPDAGAARPADAAVADAGKSTTPARTSMDAGSGTKDDETALNPDTRRDAGNTKKDALVLSSPSFAEGDELPADSRCQDREAGSSPELTWTAGPSGTAAYALLMRQVDSQAEFYSWAVVNIPADETALAADLAPTTGAPRGMRQLRNSLSNLRYDGPCDDAPSTYEFKLYALGEEVPPEIRNVLQFTTRLRDNPELVLGESTLSVKTSP